MWVVPAAGHLIRYNGEGLREQQGKRHDGDKEEDENDNDDNNDNVQNSVNKIGGGAHRDAKSVSWDSLQGDVVELPGNPLTTLSISIIFWVRIVFLGEDYFYGEDYFFGEVYVYGDDYFL